LLISGQNASAGKPKQTTPREVMIDDAKVIEIG